MYQYTSKAKASIQQIRNSGINHNSNMSELGAIDTVYPLDTCGTLQARALKGSQRAAKRRARWIAAVIGIALSIVQSPISQGSIDANKSLIKRIANKQLTDKQYDCHNLIAYKESRWNYKAVGNLNGTKRVYGLYQIKSEHIKDMHVELQFWKYWDYVSHRYGITQYDEPDYCKALHHLKTKGWQ
jgi:hypothetical protein